MKKLILFCFILSSCSFSNKKTNYLPTKNVFVDTSEIAESTDKEDFKYAYDRLLSSYKRIQNIDSLYIFDGNSYAVHLTYSCILNSKIVIPQTYFEPYLNNDLITHNFLVDLQINKNEKLFIRKSIIKECYIDKIENDAIKKYGIILYPNIRREKGNILIDVSISIPLTDIGISKTDTVKIN